MRFLATQCRDEGVQEEEAKGILYHCKLVSNAPIYSLTFVVFPGKRMRHPLLASVFYLSNHGGPTLVVDQTITEDGMEHVIK